MFGELGDDQVEQVLDLRGTAARAPLSLTACDNSRTSAPALNPRVPSPRSTTSRTESSGPRGEEFACCLEHLQVEGVYGVGTVEGESRDPVVQGGDEQISHEDSL